MLETKMTIYEITLIYDIVHKTSGKSIMQSLNEFVSELEVGNFVARHFFARIYEFVKTNPKIPHA